MQEIRSNSGPLEVMWIIWRQRTLCRRPWQALSVGDFNMGSFIFDGPFNSELKSRLLSQKDGFESQLS